MKQREDLMMPKVILLCLGAAAIVAGSSADSITILPGWWKATFEYNGEKLRSNDDFRNLLVWSPEAFAELKKSRSLYLASRITMTAGISLAGISLLQALYAGVSNTHYPWQIGATGVSVMLISLPLYSLHNKQLRNAATTFNRTVAARSDNEKAEHPFLVE